MKSAGIVIARKVQRALTVARDVIHLLKSNGVKVVVYPPVMNNAFSVSRIEDMKVDFVISIGGDGTVLRTLLYIPDKTTPILSIGLGERNFLSTATLDNYIEAIKRVLKGDYYVKEEMRLEISIENVGKSYPPVLNEVLFASRITGKTCEVHVGIKRKHQIIELWNCKADGVIISTPLGSTAYAYAAGGPIMDTNLRGLLLVPLVPVYKKPVIVLDSKKQIVIWAGLSRSPPLLVLDGQLRVEVDYYQKVFIKNSNQPARFIMIDESLDLERLRKLCV